MGKHAVEVTARSMENAIELLYRDSWRSDLARHRSNFAFRGVPDESYSLETSLVRLGGRFDELEYHLLRNFRKYAQLGEADRTASEWRWMTLGQHHGLPTRLLDWTYSPFVALHFATANMGQLSRDGVIWCVDYVECHKRLPPRLRRLLGEVGANVFTIDMLERFTDDIRRFDAMKERFALFFEPPSVDARIVNQYALFSVMPGAGSRLDPWLHRNPDLYRRVVIPKAIKWEIRDKLDQANVTERVLFPGLDGLARWLSRHYSPRGAATTPIVDMDEHLVDKLQGGASRRQWSAESGATAAGASVSAKPRRRAARDHARGARAGGGSRRS